MKKDKVVYGKNTAKTILRRVALNIVIAFLVLAGSAGLVFTLVKFRDKMSLGTIITATFTCAVGVAFFIWCMIDVFFADSQAYDVRKKENLELLETGELKDGKNLPVRGPVFWYIMTTIAVLPSVGATLFMLLSDKGAPINTLFMGPVYLLSIITFYFALYTTINRKMIKEAYVENLITPPLAQEPAVEPVVEEEKEADIKALADAQRLRLQEMVRKKAEQEAAALEMVEKAKQEAADELEKQEETEETEAVRLIAEEEQPTGEYAAPVEEVSEKIEEVAAEPVKEYLEDLDFGASESKPVIEPIIRESSAQGGVAPIVQIIFITPNARGKMPSISPINIPLPSGGNLPQTLQLVLGSDELKVSPYKIAALKSDKKKPATAANKKSTASKTTAKNPAKTTTTKPVKKATTVKKPVKKTVKTDETEIKKTVKKPVTRKTPVKKPAEEKILNQDAEIEKDPVGSTLKRVSQKLDKISKELSE